MTPTQLGEKEKIILLKAARESIVKGFRGAGTEPVANNLAPSLKEARGAFVTLTIKCSLRGCVGYIEPVAPLYQTVAQAAQAAAFEDTRFFPLTEGELSEVEIEISALTPARHVSSWREIELGRHGIIMSKYGRRALFLPQVAPENGWDLATTLSHLSMKAGLNPDDWREGADFQVFEAEVFNEKEIKPLLAPQTAPA
ncbi:MAG: AmmeMemoRadiSam system protein A [Nitrospinae bacterium]|nr:AmmeMemoRadiSam system protein A [Nitrospinota bacterium]